VISLQGETKACQRFQTFFPSFDSSITCSYYSVHKSNTPSSLSDHSNDRSSPSSGITADISLSNRSFGTGGEENDVTFCANKTHP
jgi:hypothetical protein